jgi:hypothetical protein
MVRLLMLASVFACVILPPASGVRRRERDVAALCQRVADHPGVYFTSIIWRRSRNPR